MRKAKLTLALEQEVTQKDEMWLRGASKRGEVSEIFDFFQLGWEKIARLELSIIPHDKTSEANNVQEYDGDIYYFPEI
jgi:hypothetical protein